MNGIIFESEFEAMQAINRDIDSCIAGAGIVPSDKIFYPNTQNTTVGKDDDWILITYNMSTVSPALHCGRNHIRGRCDLILNVHHICPKNIGSFKMSKVWNALCTKFTFNYVNGSLTTTTERIILMEQEPPFAEIVKTHTTTVMRFKFLLDLDIKRQT